MHTLGLTGGIGSGKSTVAQMLVACGARLIDTDAIAHALTQAGGSAMPALTTVFGPQIMTAAGALDREAMRRLAFADPSAKARLEAILHPLISDEAQRLAALALTQTRVFDVPLLGAQSLWRARVERVLVVDCSEQTQVERVARRPGWDEATARRVLAQQTGRAERRGLADAVIFNDGITLTALQSEVRALWLSWCPVA